MMLPTKQLMLTLLSVLLFSFSTFGQDTEKIAESELKEVRQESIVMSLDTVLYRIDRNNILLQSYGLKAQSYVHKGEAATSWMAPMVGVGTYMTPYPGTTTMGPDEKGSLMFQIEQAIPGRAKLNAKKKAIQSLGEVENANREITLNELKAQAKRLYINGLIAEKRIRLFEENERTMKMMKKVEELRYTYNQAMLGSIYKVEGQLAESRNQIEQQKGNIKRIKAILNSLMNLPGDFYFELDSTYTPEVNLQTSYDIAYLADRRADILKMNKSIQSMHLDIEALNLQKRPDLSSRFDHMSPLAKGGMPNSYSVMGMISIPTPWSSKMYKSESKAMEYDILAMEKEKSAMLQQSQGMLQGMHYEIQSMEKQILGMQEKVIPALQKAFDAYFVNYQENKLELPVIIDAWDALLLMKVRVLDEQLNMYDLIIDYEKEIYR
jgi:outer membrane protein TolC